MPDSGHFLFMKIGNSYPVIEDPRGDGSLIGTMLKAGYQSHFVVTNSSGKPTDPSSKHSTYDEIIVNQETQVCLFLLSILKWLFYF